MVLRLRVRHRLSDEPLEFSRVLKLSVEVLEWTRIIFLFVDCPDLGDEALNVLGGVGVEIQSCVQIFDLRVTRKCSRPGVGPHRVGLGLRNGLRRSLGSCLRGSLLRGSLLPSPFLLGATLLLGTVALGRGGVVGAAFLLGIRFGLLLTGHSSAGHLRNGRGDTC
jgi:hypothetical protein